MERQMESWNDGILKVGFPQTMSAQAQPLAGRQATLQYVFTFNSSSCWQALSYNSYTLSTYHSIKHHYEY